MILSLIKTTFRNLIKNRLFTSINISGLAIGFTAYILMSLFVNYEYSWDKHNENYDRIYRVQREKDTKHASDGNNISPHTRGITAKLLEQRTSAFEKIAIVEEKFNYYLSTNPQNLIKEELGIITEHQYLDIFTVKFIEGRKEDALIEPFSGIISKTLSDKLFPNHSPIGKSFMIEKKYTVKVTGVYEDLPLNSHIRPSYIVSLASVKQEINPRESFSGIYRTYVLLNKGANYKEVNKNIVDIFKGYDFAEYENIYLCPLSEVYINHNDNNAYEFIMRLYKLIGIFILLLASINYINFTTANVSVRAKEIAVRKVHGSKKSTLIFQFMGETLIIAVISLIVSLILSNFLTPIYSNIVNADLSILTGYNWHFIKQVVLVSLLVGLFSGAYPAFLMSSLSSLNLLKGSIFKKKPDKLNLKKVLVTFQFTTSIALIFLTILFALQIKYMLNKELGFDKKNILYARFDVTKENVNFEDLRSRILNHPEILEASMSRHIPFISYGGNEFNWEGGQSGDIINFRDNYVSYDFSKNFELTFISGRDFSREFPSDAATGCIINETALKYIGWDDPIGKWLNNKRWRVIGVVKDFHYKDMHNKIEPNVMVLLNGHETGTFTFAFKVSEGNIHKARKILTSEFEDYFPNDPFEFNELDFGFRHEGTFKTYETINKTILFFAFVNVLLAIIGLLGLVSFSIQRRTKEIGIRKINGSSALNIFNLFCSEYLVLIVIAAIICFPLEIFIFEVLPIHYKYPLQWWEFIVAPLIIIIVAVAVSSYQTIKVSLTNPVEILRYE
jgi:putative ABC transport system permease protein